MSSTAFLVPSKIAILKKFLLDIQTSKSTECKDANQSNLFYQASFVTIY